MDKENERYAAYVSILKEELIPAMGCTEPIALAYAAANAAQVLGTAPDRVVVDASGSIIKNVKSVIVPNTNHLKGIPAAVAAGIVAGKPEKRLEVISSVTPADMKPLSNFGKPVRSKSAMWTTALPLRSSSRCITEIPMPRCALSTITPISC